MDPEEVRQKLLSILGQKIVFNKGFDSYFSSLKETMQDEMIEWCQDCKEGRAKGSVPFDRRFKDRFVFFRKIGNSVRCVLVKIQNSDFIEISLVDHKEYDDIRVKLGYKQSSYYGS